MSEDDYRSYSDFCSGWYAPSEDFSGVLEEHDPNGQLLFRGTFERGERRIGQHIAYWDNGNLKEISYWVDGWICGTQLLFDEDGALSNERFFGDRGGRLRTWVERHYRHFQYRENDSGKVWWIEFYENNELKAEWIDSETREFEKENDWDAMALRAVKRFFPEFDVE